jgi:hypothetical protein
MLSQGASPQEVQQAALGMLQEMEQSQGMGSTSNANGVQMAQSGTKVGA